MQVYPAALTRDREAQRRLWLPSQSGTPSEHEPHSPQPCRVVRGRGDPVEGERVSGRIEARALVGWVR